MSKDANNPYASPMAKPAQPQQGGHGQLASLGDRFLGSLIDGVIMIIPVFGVAFAAGMLLVFSGVDPDSAVFNILSSVVGFVVGASIFLIINGYLLAKKGQTVGKVVMKTQIVSDKSGDLVPFGELVLKRYLPLWVASALPFVGGLVGLVDALMIFRGSRKCLHDDIGGTKVISLK